MLRRSGQFAFLFVTWIPCIFGQYNVLTFHGDRQRTGWINNETTLTPANVSTGSFGPIWNSPPFDSLTIGGITYPPHLYASPLYVDSVTITTGIYSGQTLHVVYAGSSNGFVYAVNAATTTGTNPVAAGTILWKKQLTTPTGLLDGVDGVAGSGIPLGILGTPVIDPTAAPARLYVVSCDAIQGWLVFALDISNGNVISGWPININAAALGGSLNQNGPTTWQGATAMSQRGALNLSLDGHLLYVPFGGYKDGGAGWMVAVDTTRPGLASAFAGAPSSVAFANGGMWASGGAAIDTLGNVYTTTGNGTTNTTNVPGYWGQSVLVWAPGAPLRLIGTYTPWNYCQMDVSDTDLAGGAPVVLPDLGVANTSTPHLITFGGKQGNQYLLDRDHMPGSLASRTACDTDSSLDKSLMPPGTQPQFGKRGPLNVFGPYSENFTDTDYAKARSTGSYFRASDGTNFLYVTGSSKAAVNSQQTVPPSIVKLKIVTTPGQPAYVAVAASENTFGFQSPGSPWVTSNGANNAIVWVLVANVLRTDSMVGPSVPHPILYALDAGTLKALWISTPAMLNVGGKYSTPAFGHAAVFVGTDRIQAFGLGSNPPPPPPGTIAVNAGGAAAGSFVADADFSGGHADTFTDAVDTSHVLNPAPMAVYQSKRTGDPPSGGFTYTFPGLTRGTTYKVRLHFVESAWTTPGQRLFNVAINGSPVLTNYDLFKAAGAFTAIVNEFNATPNSNSQIVVAYTAGSIGNPLASGIEVIPQSSVNPGISIDAGGGAAGSFVADNDVVGGHSDTIPNAVDVTGVTNPAPQAVYQSKRTGNPPGGIFTYTIPNLTPTHVYTVRLHFVESATAMTGGRLFNVSINGAQVLSNFDIFAQAGAAFKAVVKQFGITPDSAGNITIAFMYGSVGNPLISGIEILP